MKKLKNILSALLVCIILIFIIVVGYYIDFNTEKPVRNPKDAIGNTAGNIMNGGNFCEYNGYIYFSNPNDNNRLYKMTLNGKNIKKICDDSVSNINVCNDYIYYARSTPNIAGGTSYGISRCNLEGKEIKSLTRTVIEEFSLYGNTLYYLGSDENKNDCVFSYDLINMKEKKISDEAFSVASISDSKIYFANTSEIHDVYIYDTKSDNTLQYMNANSYKVTHTQDYTYYIDAANNFSLVRVTNIGGNKEVLYEGSKDAMCVTYNLYEDVIFYLVQGEEVSKLYKINADGTNKTLVLDGTVDGIFCTSKLSFVTMYKSKDIYVFNTFTDNPTPVLLKVR